jgi:hypothetical protein
MNGQTRRRRRWTAPAAPSLLGAGAAEAGQCEPPRIVAALCSALDAGHGKGPG